VEPPRATRQFGLEVARLLAERGWSAQRLGREIGISSSHLLLLIRDKRLVSPCVLELASAELGLARTWFTEGRRFALLRAIIDPELVDLAYDAIGEPVRPWRGPSRRMDRDHGR
jgi:transcriptional regulator with XRE-family HTH domain